MTHFEYVPHDVYTYYFMRKCASSSRESCFPRDVCEILQSSVLIGKGYGLVVGP
jgi:hypothetical protein